MIEWAIETGRGFSFSLFSYLYTAGVSLVSLVLFFLSLSLSLSLSPLPSLSPHLHFPQLTRHRVSLRFPVADSTWEVKVVYTMLKE